MKFINKMIASNLESFMYRYNVTTKFLPDITEHCNCPTSSGIP